MAIIYCLTFPNNKSYIGQTIQPLKIRLQQHHNKKECTAVHNAILKYKTYNTEILHIFPDITNVKVILNSYEQYYIQQYNTIVPYGYNLTYGGCSFKVSDETRLKMSKSHIGNKLSKDTKLKIKDALIGRTLSREVKNKISITKKSQILSNETKNKMSRKGMTHSEDSKKLISQANKNKSVSSETTDKLSSSLRIYGKDLNLPKYVTEIKANPNTKHGSGYGVRIPGQPSKKFIRKDLSDEQKLNLALNYYSNMKNVQRLHGSGEI